MPNESDDGRAPSAGRRRYQSARRRAQAAATRADIAAAARRRFLEGGWSGTRVRDVAREAGVSEATVYATYGSKAGLALALIDAVETDVDLERTTRELDAAAGDPRRQLAALIASDRRLFERAGEVIGVLREAGRQDSALHAAYREGRARGDRLRRRTFTSWPRGTLRRGTSRQSAVDTFAALCNIEIYHLLTEERGWTPDRVQRWWTDSLTILLIA
ncbi:MAG: TetR/AcrR family transcriptional regulator [Solirubrobacteraceae bacterium]